MFFKFKSKPVSLQTKSKLKLEKWYSLGNDFLISRANVLPEQIKQLSDRHFGIGCDQFIIFENNTVRFFNNDGSESDMCGNALKCIGEIVSRETPENGLTRQTFSINTAKREIQMKIDGGFTSICIGKPLKFKEEGNPFVYLTFEERGKRRDVNYDFFKLLQKKDNYFSFVDLGNPHLVCILNLSEEDPLLQRKIFDTFLSSESVGEVINYLGEAIQREFLKTSGVNVSFVAVESETEVYVRTFERGVGETLSCGSGACASVFSVIKSVFVSRETKLNENHEIKVFNKGSEKTEEISESFHIISLDSSENIWLKGKGKKVGDVTINN
jgi:diaminopimelate epimerase